LFPVVAEEVSRAQAAAQQEQIWQVARQQTWTEHVDVSTRTTLNCPTCGTKTAGGKFCSSCGSSLSVAAICGGCGFADNAPGAMFCSGCGHKLG
jgi:hypothetical protein